MSATAFRRGTPIYLQIAEILEREIRSRLYLGKILSEQALTARFGVNRHTLRRAVDQLIAAGMVERHHGLGLFILDNAIDYQLGPATRFTQMIEEAGHSAATQVISKQLLPATESVARQLDLRPGDEVVWIETLREVDGRPFCLVSHYLPSARCPAIWENYTAGSLHAFLRARYDIRVWRDRSLISAILPRGDDARLLHIGRHQPVLRVKGLNRDANGGPIEYCVSRFRGDRLVLSVDFPGHAGAPSSTDRP